MKRPKNVKKQNYILTSIKHLGYISLALLYVLITLSLHPFVLNTIPTVIGGPGLKVLSE